MRNEMVLKCPSYRRNRFSLKHAGLKKLILKRKNTEGYYRDYKGR